MHPLVLIDFAINLFAFATRAYISKMDNLLVYTVNKTLKSNITN